MDAIACFHRLHHIDSSLEAFEVTLHMSPAHNILQLRRENAPLMVHLRRFAAKKTLIDARASTASFRAAAAATFDKSYLDVSHASLGLQFPTSHSHFSQLISCQGLNSLRSTSLTRQLPYTSKMSTAAAALVEKAKQAAAIQAVDTHLLPSHRYVGIGSGSTVVYVVEAIVAKGSAFYQNMTFIPTGSQSKGLIRSAGLTLANLDERPMVNGKVVQLDVCFDGADEVDEDLNLIKGGGACLFQEKLVAVAARTFVAVAGESDYSRIYD